MRRLLPCPSKHRTACPLGQHLMLSVSNPCCPAMQYDDQRDAEDAKYSLDRSVVGGSEISVQFAMRGRRRPGAGGPGELQCRGAGVGRGWLGSAGGREGAEQAMHRPGAPAPRCKLPCAPLLLLSLNQCMPTASPTRQAMAAAAATAAAVAMVAEAAPTAGAAARAAGIGAGARTAGAAAGTGAAARATGEGRLLAGRWCRQGAGAFDLRAGCLCAGCGSGSLCAAMPWPAVP